MDPVFTIVGALFVMLGVAAIFDIGGAAGHMARANVQGRDTPRRRRTRRQRPGTMFPETSRGMRWWGVPAVRSGRSACCSASPEPEIQAEAEGSAGGGQCDRFDRLVARGHDREDLIEAGDLEGLGDVLVEIDDRQRAVARA